MQDGIFQYIEARIYAIMAGLEWGTSSMVTDGIMHLLPIILIPFFITTLIAIVALVFSILSYRNTKKILKKLNETENGSL